jgi:zinc/manganese transport system permease protein
MTMMLGIYLWTILAGMVAAAGLALIGAQLASREQGVQALVVSQASSLGVVVGIGVLHVLFGEQDNDHIGILPLATALVFGSGAFLAGEKFIRADWPARNSYAVALFALLLSLKYLVTSLVPSLESHLAASFFGDLAVVSDPEAQWLFLLGTAVLLLLAFSWKKISMQSFEIAIFGRISGGRIARRTSLSFLVIALGMICLSIQYLGLLFTLASLFLPTLILSGSARNLNVYTFAVVGLAVLGSLTGFLASLWHGQMPTVPAIAVAYVILGIFFRWGARAA